MPLLGVLLLDSAGRYYKKLEYGRKEENKTAGPAKGSAHVE